MSAVVTENGKEYFDTQITSSSIRDLERLLSLFNNYYQCWHGNSIKNIPSQYTVPPSIKELSQWIEEGLENGGREAWLLYRINFNPCLPPDRYSSRPRRGFLSHKKKLVTEVQYVAFALIEALEDPSEDDSESSVFISVEAQGRDPWQSSFPVALWLDIRLSNLSEALGGAHEYEMIVSERDVPLQMDLRSLGWYAEKCYRDEGDILFSKLLQLRTRKNTVGKFTKPIPKR